MLRFTYVLLLFIVACLLAGAYGAVHNQISYTVSPEYFTRFKFAQFRIDPALSDRQGAALVGWQASWWMGIVVGVFVIPFGLLIRDTYAYLCAVLRVFGLVLLTTMSFGFIALAISYVTISPADVGELSIGGNHISEPAAFMRAGMMHNFSYVGGLVGVVVGMTSLLRRFLLIETGSAKIGR